MICRGKTYDNTELPLAKPISGGPSKWCVCRRPEEAGEEELNLFALLEGTTSPDGENLFPGVRGIGDIPDGIEIELDKGSALEHAIRYATPAGRAFIAAAARAGFGVVVSRVTSVTVVRLVKARG
jgi:hypothetical protein